MGNGDVGDLDRDDLDDSELDSHGYAFALGDSRQDVRHQATRLSRALALLAEATCVDAVDVQVTPTEDGMGVLTLEARRAVGAGEGAWHGLREGLAALGYRTEFIELRKHLDDGSVRHQELLEVLVSGDPEAKRL